jgi:hypothetical protein
VRGSVNNNSTTHTHAHTRTYVTPPPPPPPAPTDVTGFSSTGLGTVVTVVVVVTPDRGVAPVLVEASEDVVVLGLSGNDLQGTRSRHLVNNIQIAYPTAHTYTHAHTNNNNNSTHTYGARSSAFDSARVLRCRRREGVPTVTPVSVRETRRCDRINGPITPR